MARKTPEPEAISERLQEAIDGLRKDVTRVEVWATALATFSKPAPEYRPNSKFELGTPVEVAGPVTDGKTAETDLREPRHKAIGKASD